MTAAGTASFTSTVTVGDLGAATDVGLESKGKVTSEGDIEIPAAAGFVGQAKIEASTHSIQCRDLTAARDFVAGQGGQITCNELIAEGTNLGPQKIRCNNDFGEMISGKYVVGTDAQYLNKVSLDVRNTAPNPVADRKADLVIQLPSGQGQGGAEVFCERNVPLTGGATNPEYQRTFKVEQNGFVSCAPIRYLALQPVNVAAGLPSYTYQAEVYDVYDKADPNSVPAPTTTILTRFANDITNDVPLANLTFFTLFQMTSSTAVHGETGFPDCGFQSKYPKQDGTINDIITWNCGITANTPGANNFVPDGAGGFIEAFKRKHWRISFKQISDITATVATGGIAIGDVVLSNFEGYIDVCIAEFPTSIGGQNDYQYKQVCYGSSVNKLQANAPPAGSRTLDRGQVRMARRNQYGLNVGGWQFFLDFPSWDLTSIGGANNPAVQMALNFTFTCLQ